MIIGCEHEELWTRKGKEVWATMHATVVPSFVEYQMVKGAPPFWKLYQAHCMFWARVRVAPSLGSCQGYSVRGEQVGPALRVVPSVVPSDVGYSMVKGVE